MCWDWKNKWCLILLSIVFLTGAVLENRCGFVDAAVKIAAALSLSIPKVVLGALGAAGVISSILVIVRVIAIRRWRAYCQSPRYIELCRRQVQDI